MSQEQKLHWEQVEEGWSGKTTPLGTFGTWRAKVPGGWFVVVSSPFADHGTGALFYPDPDHGWEIATRPPSRG